MVSAMEGFHYITNSSDSVSLGVGVGGEGINNASDIMMLCVMHKLLAAENWRMSNCTPVLLYHPAL